MAVPRSRKPTPSGSPPKAKRAKTHQKQEKQLVCFDPKKSTSNKPKKTVVKRLYDDFSSSFERAKEVQSNLSTEFPSLVKNMLHSHVIQGFWLGLPRKFCDSHLPKHDSAITLEDEEGVEWETKYLAEKVGLSGGWRGFSIAHKIAVGDAVVFQLVSRLKFKVYIVRLNGSDNVDCALCLLELEACKNEQVDTRDIDAHEEEKDETLKSFLDDRKTSDRAEMSTEVSDGIRLSETVTALEDVVGVEDFEILSNGLVINSEVSKYLRGKYLELCQANRRFLHENLLEGLNIKLVAGLISETVNVADAIRAAKITTPAEDLSVWDKTLGAFEGLGMDVGFLRARLERLASLASESERLRSVGAERDFAREELRVLEEKVSEARERAARLDSEFEKLEVDCRSDLEVTFKEVASAPW